MLDGVCMVDIRLASLAYLLVYVSTYCVPIALLRQNKLFPLLYYSNYFGILITGRLMEDGS